jgi:hypothetical protein
MKIYFHVILLISILVKNISCTGTELAEFKTEVFEYIDELKQKNVQLEATVTYLKNTVDVNNSTIQSLQALYILEQ